MINPRMFDNMSWRMAEVYGACVDRLLVNIAHYFPYIQAGQEPKGTFDYMVRMLANMGQVNRESVKIIEQSLQGEDEALRGMLMSAIRDVIMDIDPTLRKAAEQGLLGRVAQPVLDPSTTQAFQMFYKQSADKLNLVNTVMLESTEHAYQSTVSDIVYRVNAQGVLNSAAGQVVTGVETWNRAMNQAVAAMAQQGLTGFIDHAGRHWTPEAYVAMDIRTTVSNTARAAVWEQNEEYGNDMYSVSSHNGARPLCYPWQGKVISQSDTVRDVEDLQGNVIHVYAQSETSYGEPAGLFGINCGHYPYPFIPGLSMVRGEPQDPEENEETYQESQEQRRLERDLRTAKRDLAVEKARGAPKEVLQEKKAKVDAARGKLDDFCERTGRHRRSAREGTPINARFPDKGSYTVGDMPQTVRNQMRQYYQQQAQPTAPVTPTVAQTAPVNVAQQATQPLATTVTNAVQSKATSDVATQILPNSGIDAIPFERWDHTPTEAEIIASIGGADRTSGSCASVALAYAGNKAGYNVHDYRGGASLDWFSRKSNTTMIAQLPDIGGIVIQNAQEIKTANQLLAQMQKGKEYWLGVGRHASIVRLTDEGYQYLELQSATDNGWHKLDDYTLRYRFGAVKKRSMALNARLMDVEKLGASPDFVEILQYLNTEVTAQKKGIGGGIK